MTALEEARALARSLWRQRVPNSAVLIERYPWLVGDRQERPAPALFSPLPPGPYGAILADCPWRFRNWSSAERASRGEAWARRNGRAPYDVLDTDTIARLPVQEMAAKDAVLFLWATYPKLPDALSVMEAWGFQFKSVAYTWAKLNPSGKGWHFGLGYWTRGNPELCLLGTRGKPKRLDRCVPNLVVSPRGRHSAKPDEVRARIERLVAGPYVELFARGPVRPGWTAWGDEVETGLESVAGGRG